MFTKLFGPTLEAQLRYLQPRVIVTLLLLVTSGILAFFVPETIGIIAIIFLFIWGWGATKSMFGWASIGSIFAWNLAIGIILFMLAITIAYFIGIIVAIIGVIRYIQLKLLFSRHSA